MLWRQFDGAMTVGTEDRPQCCTGRVIKTEMFFMQINIRIPNELKISRVKAVELGSLGCRTLFMAFETISG
jgi:hypothetical protein